MQKATASDGEVVYKHKVAASRRSTSKVANDVTLTLEPVAAWSGDPLGERPGVGGQDRHRGHLPARPEQQRRVDGRLHPAGQRGGVGRHRQLDAPIFNAAGAPEYGADLPGKTWKLFMDTYLAGKPTLPMATKQLITGGQNGRRPPPTPTLTAASTPSASTDAPPRRRRARPSHHRRPSSPTVVAATPYCRHTPSPSCTPAPSPQHLPDRQRGVGAGSRHRPACQDDRGDRVAESTTRRETDTAADRRPAAEPHRPDGLARDRRHRRPVGPARGVAARRWWTPLRVVARDDAASRCCSGSRRSRRAPTGNWTGHKQYTHFCYSDVVPLWSDERLDVGAVPYRDTTVEYPVLTGAFMWLTAELTRGVHALDADLVRARASSALLTAMLLALCGLVVTGGDRADRRGAARTTRRSSRCRRCWCSTRSRTGTCSRWR